MNKKLKLHWCFTLFVLILVAGGIYYFLEISIWNPLPFGPDLHWHIVHAILHFIELFGPVSLYFYLRKLRRENCIIR